MNTADLLLLLVVAAIAVLWLPERQARGTLAFGLLGAAGFPALQLGALSFAGLAWAGLLFAAGRDYRHPAAPRRRLARSVFVALLLTLGFGVLPGFEAVPIGEPTVLKSGSSEFALAVKLDKVLAGFALLAFAIPLTRTVAGWAEVARGTGIALVVTAPLVLAIGWISGYVDLAPAPLPVPFLAAWAAANLFIVTALEEGFFRGIVQHRLTPRLGSIAAVAIAALLFGLAHFGGGALYVALATLAGLGYGAAYQLAGRRIEAAMLTHFGVNLLHLLLFTYPRAA